MVVFIAVADDVSETQNPSSAGRSLIFDRTRSARDGLPSNNSLDEKFHRTRHWVFDNSRLPFIEIPVERNGMMSATYVTQSVPLPASEE
jgi:hypothetical protein